MLNNYILAAIAYGKSTFGYESTYEYDMFNDQIILKVRCGMGLVIKRIPIEEIVMSKGKVICEEIKEVYEFEFAAT